MQGRAAAQRRTNADLLASVIFFERALQEDGKYALAYAGLADAYANLGYYGSIAPIEGRRKAEEAAHKALELDDKLAEAHAALALVYIGFARRISQLATESFGMRSNSVRIWPSRIIIWDFP